MSRMNISTIAELLIDRLDKMEQVAKRIEKASEKELKIDSREIRNLLNEDKLERIEIHNNLKYILSDFKSLKNKNHTRVSNKIVMALCASFLVCIVMTAAMVKSNSEFERKAIYYELKYLELQEKIEAKKVD